MTTNPTPNQVFVANAVPSGGFFVKLYRPTNTAGSITWAVIAEAVRVLTFNPSRECLVVDRPDIDGGDNGWTATAGKIEGGITLQLATDATPTYQPGDAFVTSVIFREPIGTAVQQMVVLTSLSVNMDTNSRAMSGTARVNKQATNGGTGYDQLDALEEYGV